MEPLPDQGGYGLPVKSSLMQRLIGIVTFKSDIYREIAKDEDAMGTAVILVIVFSLIGGIISGLFAPLTLGPQLQDPEVRQILSEFNIDPATFIGAGTVFIILFAAIVSPIVNLIGWVIFAPLNAFVANKFFSGNTTSGQVMRVFGFAHIFVMFGGIPCIGAVFGTILPIFTNIIGVREAAELQTGNAVLTWLISIIIIIAIWALIICAPLFLIFALAGAGS